MNIKLIASTVVHDEVYNRIVTEPNEYVDEADRLHEYAGRLCYRSFHRPRPETALNDDYLANILKQGHYSVLEHSSATFLIEGVSRHLLGELTRHRHTSPSVESLRYCPPRTYAIHPTLAEFELEHELAAQWETSLLRYTRVYDHLIDNKGLSKKQAAEAAAQFLPLSTATDLVLTGNMRSWRELISKRDADGANREIRELAKLLLVELKRLAPNSFQDMEP